MLIHELTQRPEKINEDLKSFLGLNNATVAQAWDQIGGELMQDLAARYTKDPRYTKMPLDQRKKAMAADASIQQISKEKYGQWNQYISGLQAKTPTPLTDDQYKAAFINWANQSLFNNQFSGLDNIAKAQAQRFFDQFVSYRNTAEPSKTARQTDFINLIISDETARMVQVATDLQRAQAAAGQSAAQKPAAGQPTTSPTTAASTVSFGGEPQNPNDPATAKLLAMAKQQGKLQ